MKVRTLQDISIMLPLNQFCRWLNIPSFVEQEVTKLAEQDMDKADGNAKPEEQGAGTMEK